jgi:PleD family two-component response regulator
LQGYGTALTLSIGIAQANLQLSGVGELIKNADRALYQEKSLGRNRFMPAEVQETATSSDNSQRPLH